MWIFPLAAAVIAAVFGTMLLLRSVRRRSPADGMWAIAMAMYAAASFAMFLGVLSTWSAAEFRVYWLLGGALNVPYLAQGELYLLLPRPAANVILPVLLFGTAFAISTVGGATVQLAPLTKSFPLGKDVFGASSTAHGLPQLYSIPAYVVLGAGAAWSAWRMRRIRALRDRAHAVFLIFLGATIVAIGSGIGAGFGVVPLFSVSLAAGIAVMFLGFVRSTRPSGP